MCDSVPSVPISTAASESLNGPSTLAEDVGALKCEPSDIVSASHSESPREDALYFTHDENDEPTSDLSSFIEGLDERNGLYDAIPPNLYIKKTEYAGRGVFASKPIRAGSTVFRTTLAASVLSTPHLAAFCSSCFVPATPERSLKRCARCQTVHYCSPTCSQADWVLHKPECAALRRWANAAPNKEVAVPSEAIRCIARMLWARQKQGSDSSFAKELDAMQSHRSAIVDPKAASSDAQVHLAHALVRYLDLSSPSDLAAYGITSPTELVALLSRFATNALTLSTSALAPIGVFVSPVVALINHACEPNAVVVFPSSGGEGKEARATVVAIREIKAGEEVTTAYIDTTLPTDQRQVALNETYHFDCACSICKPSSKDFMIIDPRESMWCPRSCGGTCSLPRQGSPSPKCIKCGAGVPSNATDAILDAIRLGSEGLEKAQAIQGKDPAHALRLATKLLPLVRSAGLTPGSHPLLGLARLRQAFLIDALSNPAVVGPEEQQKALDEAIRNAGVVCEGLSAVLSRGHPVRAVACAELGKLLAADEPAPASPPAPAPAVVKPDGSSAAVTAATATATAAKATSVFPPSDVQRILLAKTVLAQAHEELVIGFGKEKDAEGGDVGREVRELLVRLEGELGVLKNGIRNVRQSERAAG